MWHILDAVRLYRRWPAACVADFRREYNLSWSALLDLAPGEFCALLHGLSASSRLVAEVAARAATVNRVEPWPAQSVDEFISALSRHPGMVVERVSRVGR